MQQAETFAVGVGSAGPVTAVVSPASATCSVENRTVLLVEDGLATSATAEAALRWLRRQQTRRIVLAVPVSSGDTARRLRHMGPMRW